MRYDGQTLTDGGMLAAVGNGFSYGGGMRVCEGAEVDDGLLSLGDEQRPVLRQALVPEIKLVPVASALAQLAQEGVALLQDARVLAQGVAVEQVDLAEGDVQVPAAHGGGAVDQRDRVEDARSLLKEGDTVEAKFVGVDKKSKSISLSIKAKDQDEESNAIKDYSKQSAGTPTLGDLFKQIEK